MAVSYILARTLKEAHAFARGELGLSRGQYRIVNGVGTLKSVRGVDLYLLPGWQNRYDRFAMKSGLRWTRMNVIDVATTPVKAPAPEPDGLEPVGVQLSFDELTANVGEVSNGNNMISEGGPVAPEPETPAEPEAKEPKAKRRRRCKECGILVEPDEVEDHAKDHENDLLGAP